MDVSYNFIGSINDQSVDRFIYEIENIKQPINTLTINISSLGSGVTPAIAMYNYLKSKSVKVYTHNLSEVSSAAILIYLAGEKRTAEDVSKFMIHPITICINESSTYYKVQEILNGVEADIKNYADIVNTETNNLMGKHSNNVEHFLKCESLHFNKQSAFDCGIVNQI